MPPHAHNRAPEFHDFFLAANLGELSIPVSDGAPKDFKFFS
jgi:hypothetical protein